MQDQYYNSIVRYLSKEMNTEEVSQFEHDLSVDSNLREEFEAFQEIWSFSGPSFENHQINQASAWEKINQRIETPKIEQTQKSWAWLKIAASVLLVIGLGFGSLQLFSPNGSANHMAFSSVEDGQAEIQLADGTIVYLNHHSSLSYPKSFDGDIRMVELDGEAFFKVSPNAEKPFIVNTSQSKVQVLGTAFNLKANAGSDKHVLSVKEGKVAFSDQNESNKKIVVAGKGSTLELNSSNVEVYSLENENFFAWKEAVLNFEETKLDVVLEDLESVFGIDFKLKDSALKNCTFTAKFDKTGLDQILETIKLSLDLQITQHNNTFELAGEPCM